MIDTATKPNGEEYSQQYAEYLEEYARDSDKFQEKYGGTQSYEHPHPGKRFHFCFYFFHFFEPHPFTQKWFLMLYLIIIIF